MELGVRIREARLGRKMTVSALAAASDLTKGFISQVESGKSNPSLASISRIALALEVPLAALVAPSATPATSTASEAALLVVGKVYQEAPGIAGLSGKQSGAHSLAALPPSTALTNAVASPNARTGNALLVVLHGTVQIREMGNDMMVMSGEVASWNAALPYTIENRGDIRASLLVFLPEGCPMPALTAIRRPVASQRPTPSLFVVPEGPMRLVAMRANRLAERSR